MISLGQAHGIAVYGEGIEDEAQRLRLRRSGCDIGQGYLFARPLPAEDAAALIRAQAAPVPGGHVLAGDAAIAAIAAIAG